MRTPIAGLTENDLRTARNAYGDIIMPSLLKRALPWLISVLVVGYLAWLWIKFGLTPGLLVKGATQLWTFIVGHCKENAEQLAAGAKCTWIAGMLPPDPGPYTGEFLRATAETLGMAFLGTCFSAVVAFPLAYLGASNVVPNPVVHFVVRRTFDAFRGIPALIWALVFVASIGLGPMAGVLALAMTDFAPLAKLGAEAIENADRKPVEGALSVGATRFQVLRFAYLPQILPVQLSQALYFFESNVRSAAVLGIVGAGGIGYYLSDLARNNHWDMVAFILIVFLILVAAIDWSSKRLRTLIVGERS